MIDTSEICFRCNKPLYLTEKLEDISFYNCASCKRNYAKEPGKDLTDRWMSPLSIVLYDIIYNKERISDETIEIVADRINTYETKQIEAIIDDINEELVNPKQKLIAILDLHGTEENARDYLKRLVKRLKV
ncbi:hypothetical protein [Eudoraea adriatica]|uniref:hypothetical protein n=1 Tax=Eudoraea adriatica TaxID=446681 RepID=UPI0003697C49|nr:hypothetical protein [Eudoraea adriatica]